MAKRMILAESDKTLRELLVGYISDYAPNVEIEQVADGVLLVERVRNNEYSLVLTDNEKLPRMSGLKAVEQIRESEKGVPIYVLSVDHIEKEVLKTGATGYIRKIDILEKLPPVLKKYLG